MGRLDKHKIDQEMGWHLLVAACPGRRIWFDNAPSGLAEHWCEMRQELQAVSREEADVVIDWFLTDPQSITVSTDQNKRLFREYALVPPNAPRLVIPLANHEQTLLGLRLHRPGRRSAIFITRILYVLATLRIFWPLRRRCLRISDDLRAEEFLTDDSLLYLGTSDDSRKTTIKPSTGSVIYKYGRSKIAKDAIRNEIDALTFLIDTPISNRVPNIYSTTYNDNFYILGQEFRHKISRQITCFDPELIKFLSDLSTIGFETRNGLPGHRSHGDFAPWNVAYTEAGIFVYDWEDSKAWEPALSDAFHFVVAPYVHVPGTGTWTQARDEAFRLAEMLCSQTSVDAEQIEHLWRTWLRSGPFRADNPIFRELLLSVGKEKDE